MPLRDRLVAGARAVNENPAVGLSVLSQVLSSATNAIVSVVGSIVLVANDFGALAAAMIAYRLALLVNRSAVTSIVIIRTPELDESERSGFLVGSLATSVIIAGLAAIVVALSSLLFDRTPVLQSDLEVLALAMPGLVAHETLRSQAFAVKRPGVAVAGDAIWLAVAVALLGVYRLEPWLSLSSHLLASWMIGAYCGAVVMARSLHKFERVRSVIGRLKAFFVSERRAGAAFMTHSVIDVGAAELANGVIVGAVGLSALGRWTTANVAFSPVVPLERGAMQWAVPNRSELMADSSPRALYESFRVLAARLAGAAAALSSAVALLVVLLAPLAPENSVWRTIGVLLPAAFAITVIRAAKAPFAQILQILGTYRWLVRTQILDSATVLGTIVVSSQFTIVHVAYAFAGQNLIMLYVWARRARSVSGFAT